MTKANSINVFEDLFVSLLGFFTRMLTAIILWWIEIHLGFAFYALILFRRLMPSNEPSAKWKVGTNLGTE